MLVAFGLFTSASALVAQGDEARPLIVRGLRFEGNRAIDDFTLSVSIATSQSGFFARWPLVRWIGLGNKRRFNETEFRRDVLRIAALYRRSGYREVSVDTLVRRSDGDVYIRFLIDEGRPVRVTTLRINGTAEAIPERALLRRIPLQVGEPFNLLLLQASVDTIRTALRDRGHPYPEIFQNFDADVEAYTADVSLDVVPGVVATVDSVEVLGTSQIDPSVVRKTISITPGERFSEQELYRSQLDLFRTNLFNYVNVSLTDTLPSDPGDTTVTVRVQVTEDRLRRIRLGWGYGTVDCFRTLGAWTLYDFLGGGRSLDVSTRLSKIGTGRPIDWGFQDNVCFGLNDETEPARLELNYNLTASLREPFFLSRKTSATLSFTAERYSEFQAFLRQSVGGEFGITWRTPVDIPITLSYALANGATEAEPAIFCAFLDVCRVQDTEVFTEFRNRSMLSLRFVWDRSDSPLDPTRGMRVTGEVRHASQLIGSDSLIQFTRGVVELASYHRVARRSVFAWRVRVGAVTSPRINLGGVEGRFTPPEDRFYGGGPNSVRGFSQNELGPQVLVLVGDTMPIEESRIRSSANGGNQLVLANAEYRFPLPVFQRTFGAIFVDAGQVFERGGEGEGVGDIRVTPGAGLRIGTPLGPIRLDIAYNGYRPRSSPLYAETAEGELFVLREPDEFERERTFLDRFRVHFSVGQAF